MTYSHTVAVAGAIAVPSGGTNYIPPFYEPVPSGRAKTLVGARYVCRTGTVTFNVTQNGSVVSGYSGLGASSTAASVTPTAVSVNDGDLFAVVVTAVASTPDSLTVSLIFATT
jgi:hypothetical protein